MIDMINFINARLDRLAVLPLAFAIVMTGAVIATAVFEDGSAPTPQAMRDDNLTTIAADVP
jgi:hypothetical protein